MLFAPLLSALIYPLGSLWIKQGQMLGAGPWRIAVIGNLIIAACFMPLLIFCPDLPNWDFIVWPLLAGFLFFGGQFFTVLALRFGDVSMIAPMMGCKTLFVALYSSWMGVETLGATLWLAALLTAIAIFLLGWGDEAHMAKRSPWLAAGLALISGALFAGVDTLVGYAGKSYGRIPMLVTAMIFFGMLSLLLLPIALRERPSPAGRKPIIFGNIAFGIQAAILNIANVMLARPTVINIIYSSRGLFGLTHTWFIGHRFENTERHEVSSAMMLRRCAGAVLLIIAILLVVLNK